MSNKDESRFSTNFMIQAKSAEGKETIIREFFKRESIPIEYAGDTALILTREGFDKAVEAFTKQECDLNKLNISFEEKVKMRRLIGSEQRDYEKCVTCQYYHPGSDSCDNGVTDCSRYIDMYQERWTEDEEDGE